MNKIVIVLKSVWDFIRKEHIIIAITFSFITLIITIATLVIDLSSSDEKLKKSEVRVIELNRTSSNLQKEIDVYKEKNDLLKEQNIVSKNIKNNLDQAVKEQRNKIALFARYVLFIAPSNPWRMIDEDPQFFEDMVETAFRLQEIFAHEVIQGGVIRWKNANVHLFAMDAPLLGESCYHEDKGLCIDCGARSALALTKIISGKKISCSIIRDLGKDNLGRKKLIGDCWVEGANLSIQMIRDGWAVFNAKEFNKNYQNKHKHNKNEHLAAMETGHKAKSGLWKTSIWPDSPTEYFKPNNVFSRCPPNPLTKCSDPDLNHECLKKLMN